ncbi:hypothetical protein KFL_000030080 [Klebsormidium nitens]|uniref:Uncharacterized protein n=1 Tax=Klebsormidium nitens TaxID=105231 RepID=A0A1Y1HPI0_KLENI|nr:hypothetical protein KFL_000030080 [Klebsormidium nitens]|eukprot:GAQ77728.1 hypothetical protein KFL_000030080 [Klebsormidium nitens]
MEEQRVKSGQDHRHSRKEWPDEPSVAGRSPEHVRKGEHRGRDRKGEKHRRRNEERGSSSDTGEESEGERQDKRNRRKRKERSDTDSESDDSEEERRERRKRRKEKRRRREEKKLKKEKKSRSKGGTNNDSGSGEDEKTKKRLLKEAKKFLKKHSSKGGQELVLSAVGRKVEPISTGDYFQKNAEFATWLREGRGIFFSDLSSDQAHALFDAFVTVYNEGKLPEKYYDGITSTHAKRSGFTWAIKGRGDTGEDIMAEEDRRAAEAGRGKLERKKWMQDQELLLDEMLPKATGREAALEKKAARREQQRGREDSPELMRDKDLLGGGDDFQQRLARERQRREKRVAAKADAVAEKVTAYEAAEQAKLNQFRALIGASGGKISISKRAE